MKILVACEESQRVCIEFRKRGHEAFSCDVLPCSGGHPEWHIQGDVVPLLNGDCTFQTSDTHTHTQVGPWDLIIGFPPCTHLAVSGARWFPEKQKDFRQQKACVFFMQIALAHCKHVAVENPVGIMSNCYRKPDQIIQPWQFAIYDWEITEKSTCLWLKGLSLLTPRIATKPEINYHTSLSGKRQTDWYYKTRCLPREDRAKAASKTFPGIALAFAEQWG